MSSVAFAVSCASSLTSLATTAKPLPASPARAASIVAFSASRLVCSAMLVITLTTLPISAEDSPSFATVAVVVSGGGHRTRGDLAGLRRVRGDLPDRGTHLLGTRGDRSARCATPPPRRRDTTPDCAEVSSADAEICAEDADSCSALAATASAEAAISADRAAMVSAARVRGPPPSGRPRRGRAPAGGRPGRRRPGARGRRARRGRRGRCRARRRTRPSRPSRTARTVTRGSDLLGERVRGRGLPAGRWSRARRRTPPVRSSPGRGRRRRPTCRR